MGEEVVRHLDRTLGFWGLTATGVCSMVGGAINFLPIMLQREIPGIGDHVALAYLLGAIPAILAAMAYASLSSIMPRAGGSYTYASRSLHPYLGFVASFSYWLGISIAIGVIAYMVVPFLRDVAVAADMIYLRTVLDGNIAKLVIPVGLLWLFVAVNMFGVRAYERTIVPLMFVVLACGFVVIAAGILYSHDDFRSATAALSRDPVSAIPSPPLTSAALLSAISILFGSYAGFDSIAQAGGEAKNPRIMMPLAIITSVLIVMVFYVSYTMGIYKAVPWNYIYDRVRTEDLTAPGLLLPLLGPGWTIVVLFGAVAALISHLPAMLLSVSRLMFAWAADGVFPDYFGRVSANHQTPYVGLFTSAALSTLGIVGCHLAGNVFLGINLLAMALIFNFLLVCISLCLIPWTNDAMISKDNTKSLNPVRILVGLAGAITIGYLFCGQIKTDLAVVLPAWYQHATYLWLTTIFIGSLIFASRWRCLRREGVDLRTRFSELPDA